MALETLVKKHYGRRANFTEELLERARTTAKNPGTLTVDDMGAYDEFHIGGRAATEYLSERMMFEKGASCLDVGCGIGGPARYMAKHYDVDVTGIDLTPEFIVMAKELSSALGDSGNTKFDAGSALDMPYADGSFDCATQFHVGMNIEDKKTLFSQVHRVLKPQAVFGVYDVMRVGDGELSFPLPWSEEPAASHVDSVSHYEELLLQAGFVIFDKEDRSEFAAESVQRGLDIIGKEHPMHEKFSNLLSALQRSIVSPHILMCKRT